MKIYLVQHGDCALIGGNSEQTLNETGKQDIKHLANFLSKKKLQVTHIYHSEKVRARETAEILLSGITSLNSIELLPGINPMDSVIPIVKQINGWKEDVVIVGHLPFMAKCVAKLITDDENNSVVIFERGTIVCLEKIGDIDWAINWMLRPELFL